MATCYECGMTSSMGCSFCYNSICHEHNVGVKNSHLMMNMCKLCLQKEFPVVLKDEHEKIVSELESKYQKVIEENELLKDELSHIPSHEGYQKAKDNFEQKVEFN